MKITTTLSSLFILIMFFGCSEMDKSFEEPLPDIVTYDSQIKTILDQSCVRCHHGGPELQSSLNLSSFNEIEQLIGTVFIDLGNSNSYLLITAGPEGKMYMYLNDYRDYELLEQWIVIDSAAEH
ncbi:MAG: hypothetical protein IIB95_01470 [Candidatus Marinimicrobia bacterium]|nr:hypothetical protein [Candidatus Neomarinimicrobiota bacterium]